MDLLLAIDAGTTSVKAGLFAPDGRMLALSREEYRWTRPRWSAPSWTRRCTGRPACGRCGVRSSKRASARTQIRALGVSSQGETTITLDREGRAIYPAMVWLDNRAVDQAAELAKKFSDQVYDVCGVQELIPTWTACKLLWLRENEPEVFARAWKFMLVQDFLIYRMTGRAVTDGSVACTSALYDIRSHVWWPEMLAAVGIEAEPPAGDHPARLAGRAADRSGGRSARSEPGHPGGGWRHGPVDRGDRRREYRPRHHLRIDRRGAGHPRHHPLAGARPA